MSHLRKVEEWYRSNVELLVRDGARVEFHSDSDPTRGGAVIEMEYPSLLATITVWNKGDVAVAVLLKGSPHPFYLDDRILRPEESIEALLDNYRRGIRSFA